jgi:hypothetical protein
MNMYAMVYDKQVLGDILPKHDKRRNMIMKKRILVAAAFAIFIMSWVIAPAVVTAAPGYLNCVVNSVGVGAGANTGYGPIQMTCGSDPLKNFEIVGGDSTGTNRALAALLTAISSEKNVMVYVDDTAGLVPKISVIYVVK